MLNSDFSFNCLNKKSLLISLISFVISIILLLASNDAIAQFEEISELPLIATIPGNQTTCVAIQGGYAYVGAISQSRVQVFDISNPESPQIVASVLVRSPWQIIIKDDLAFVACRQNGLTILDISDPTNPLKLSRYDTIEYCCKVDVAGNILFATNRYAGLEIIDISDPLNPQFINKIVLDGECQGVIIQKKYMYITQWLQSRIIVLDISDPRSPVEVAIVPLDGYGQGLDVRGDLLCAATGEQAKNSQHPGDGCGMDVYDVSNPVQPVHLATIKTPPFVGGLDIWSVIISGRYAFVTDGFHGVYIIDLWDPVNPSIQAHATTQGFAPNLAVGDGYIYVCDYDSGLKIFEAEDYAFIPEERETIQLPITDPTPIVLPPNFSVYRDKGSFHSVDILGNMVVSAAGDGGLHLIQLKPEIKKIYSIDMEDFSFALDVSVWGEDIFVAETNGLSVWQLDGSNQFVKKGCYGNSAFRVQALRDNRVLLAENHMRIKVLDTSDPANPKMIRNILMPHFIREICKTVFKQHYACVVHTNGFSVINLDDPNDPNQYTFPQPSVGGAIYEDASDILGYFVGYNKLYIYDMKQDYPNLISLINLRDLDIEFSGNLTIENSMLILSSWENGNLAIFDISNPLNPAVITVHQTGFNCGPISYHNGAYIIPNGRGGLLFMSEKIIYEDAEDGSISGWEIYDDDPSGAEITNIFDEDRQSRIIHLSGSGYSNGYRLRNDDLSKWHNSTQFVIEWSMKCSESFTVYVDVETTAGHRFLTYKPVDYDGLGDGTYVYHGLGFGAIDGQWHTHVRDLSADLQEAQPGVTILEVNGFFIRGSGSVDDIKLFYYIPVIHDSDGDGIADADETNIYGTNPDVADTDSDGIDDGEELEFWGDDWNVDYDTDGLINLLDPDADDDGFLDGEEIEAGSDPGDPGSTPTVTTYEDAEDGSISGWEIYDNTPDGAQITNVFDEERQSRVIQLSGYGNSNGYRLRNDDLSNWHNSSQFVIEWSMKYSEFFIVYIDVETTAGPRFLTYKPVDHDALGNGTYIYHGLGTDAVNGEWQTFVRDLPGDLEEAQPGVTLLEVNALLIRGSGMIDDIKLRNHIP